MKKPVFFLLTMIICSYISFACANISDYKVMTWNLQGGFAPIFPDTCYHLTHYWPAAADIPV
ncbi:hypothetical protein NA770_21720, partial [Salmonella sp. NW286]